MKCAAAYLLSERNRSGREDHGEDDEHQCNDTHGEVDLDELAGQHPARTKTLCQGGKGGAALEKSQDGRDSDRPTDGGPQREQAKRSDNCPDRVADQIRFGAGRDVSGGDPLDAFVPGEKEAEEQCQPARLKNHGGERAIGDFRLQALEDYAAAEAGENGPAHKPGRSKPDKNMEDVREIVRPNDPQLHAGNPGVLGFKKVDAGLVRRQRNCDCLCLMPANEQKWDSENPPPGNFDQHEARAAKYPAHVIDHLLGPTDRPGRVRVEYFDSHFTTRFTSFPGTTIILAGFFPLRRARTFSSARAAASIRSRPASAGTRMTV